MDITIGLYIEDNLLKAHREKLGLPEPQVLRTLVVYDLTREQALALREFFTRTQTELERRRDPEAFQLTLKLTDLRRYIGRAVETSG